MKELERRTQKKPGESDRQQILRKESPPISGRFQAWEQGTFPITETPFRPPVAEHAGLLARAHSNEGRANLVIQLQKTYGNRYVQRLLNSMAVFHVPRQPEEEELQTKSLLQRQVETEAGVIARTPAASSKGTITISAVKKTHYNVTGNNLAEVSTQLDPEEWGRCTWEWTQSYRTTEGVTDRVNINLKLTIRLPRWTGRGWRRASAEEKVEWNRMLECLQKHEDRHAEIARSWTPTLQERLLNQPESDIATLWSDGLAEHQDEQDGFDADTGHGQTEGVTLDTSIGPTG
jgi:hypothetical protein